MRKIGIVAFAFGKPSLIRSNRIIAGITAKKAMEDNAPIFTQEDIQFPEELNLSVTYIKDKYGKPPSTLQIAKKAVKWAEANFFENLIVVAAGPHMWRCLRDIRRVAREEAGAWYFGAEIYPHPGMCFYKKEDWFCMDSTQPWTATEKEWQKRDWAIQFMPWWLYKRMAAG
ncbi:MAG: hypothetical protein A2735_02240 [Candidatus Yanofskybacteria bacterium RIFCSPHIGHO2_01_FULL_41_21]|uniref:DUF218 domain-containing protein n=1 Tax=Candidatus Yanofskybacteria bacterium RIFCSPHIGHO2_01_FULL_41_21 TaxID=1802660 RepID=A0A1F8E9W8_9BACT|nr:MAG: hypothetical protein A2735_02240 [Candidatus Yanofskybacteria bacterium RIFCSPHIGHO2_01_FULL_41_21]